MTMTALGSDADHLGTKDGRKHAALDLRDGMMDQKDPTPDLFDGKADQKHRTLDLSGATTDQKHPSLDLSDGTTDEKHPSPDLFDGTADQKHATPDLFVRGRVQNRTGVGARRCRLVGLAAVAAAALAHHVR